MNTALQISFWFSVIVLIYIYAGYHILLASIFWIKKNKNKCRPNKKYKISNPEISIIISVLNEKHAIVERVQNLVELRYPKEKLEIIIASDGSTDNTVHEARNIMYENLIILDFLHNRGRAAVHNDSVKISRGNILLFTDAETRFDSNFLTYLIPNFADKEVGCAVGNLNYITDHSKIAEAESLYFKYEKKLRVLESSLGILATGTGACMAVRKKLWKPLGPIDDVDFITPLDVIMQGSRVVFEPKAKAFDFPPKTIRSELTTRIRQTSRNFAGTLKRWNIHTWKKYHLITFSLVSHKFLRWMTPYFLFCLFILNIMILKNHWIYSISFFFQFIFYAIGAAGYICEKKKIKIPFAGQIFSFILANIGMAIGLFNATFGNIPTFYKNK